MDLINLRDVRTLSHTKTLLFFMISILCDGILDVSSEIGVGIRKSLLTDVMISYWVNIKEKLLSQGCGAEMS